MRSLHFSIRDDVPSEEHEVSFNLSYNSKYDYKTKSIDIILHLSIGEDSSPFEIDIEFEGLFFLNKRVSKKNAEPLARINCPAILFPFLRECVADITRRAGFSPLLLPSINFVKLGQQERPKPSKKKIGN